MVKILAVVSALFLTVFSTFAMACGTLPAEQQQRIEAEQLQQLRVLAVDMANTADSILVGIVTALQRPVRTPQRNGQVTLRVSKALKGPQTKSIALAWNNHFLYSCNAAAAFGNVGFRESGEYIVYVKDGEVIRSAAADTSLLKLSDEISLVVAQSGH